MSPSSNALRNALRRLANSRSTTAMDSPWSGPKNWCQRASRRRGSSWRDGGSPKHAHPSPPSVRRRTAGRFPGARTSTCRRRARHSRATCARASRWRRGRRHRQVRRLRIPPRRRAGRTRPRRPTTGSARLVRHRREGRRTIASRAATSGGVPTPVVIRTAAESGRRAGHGHRSASWRPFAPRQARSRAGCHRGDGRCRPPHSPRRPTRSSEHGASTFDEEFDRTRGGLVTDG